MMILLCIEQENMRKIYFIVFVQMAFSSYFVVFFFVWYVTTTSSCIFAQNAEKCEFKRLF